MATLTSQSAQLLSDLLVQLPNINKIIEFRLHTTCDVDDKIHSAYLTFYTHPSDENPSENIFQNDSSVDSIDLLTTCRPCNKEKFVCKLKKETGIYNPYLSRRISLDFNLNGFENVSARRNIAKLIAVLP